MMKKLSFITLIMILIVSCKGEKPLSEEQIDNIVNIIENDGLESFEEQNLSELELEFGRCFRQCRKTFKANKPPLKITIGEADMIKYNISGIEYNRLSVTDSGILYNAYIAIVRAHCIDGCEFEQPIGDKVSLEYNKFNEAYNKLVKAKGEIEKAKQAETETKDKEKKEIGQKSS